MAIRAACLSLSTRWRAALVTGSLAFLVLTFASPSRAQFVDPRTFGANPAAIQTTASTIAGSPNVMVALPWPGKNRNGITIYGAGPNALITTAPSAPTVVTGRLQTNMTPDAMLTVDNTGSNTDCYIVFAMDVNGGISPPSAATCLTTALPLGVQNIAVSSKSLSGNVLTITTAANHRLTTGTRNMKFHIWNGTNPSLSGYYHATSVTNGKTFSVNTPLYTPASSPITDTGGNAVYWNANQVSEPSAIANLWQYGVCAKRVGDAAYHLVGMMHPYTMGTQDMSVLKWTDFGPPYSSAPGLPSYLTDAACTNTSSKPGNLTATVLNGEGATSLTLSKDAGQTVRGATTYEDDGPAFTAAANYINSTPFSYHTMTLVVPAGGLYHFYSKVTLNVPRILVLGALGTAEAITTSANWEGVASRIGPQFAYEANTGVSSLGAYPVIWSKSGGQNTFKHVTVNAGNQGLGVLVDSYLITDYFNCSTGSVGDYVGTCMYVDAGFGFNTYYDHGSFTGGPSQTADASWGCEVEFQNAPMLPSNIWSMHFDNITPRGICQYGYGWGVEITLEHVYDQGAIEPYLSLYSMGVIGLAIKESLIDTSPVANYEIWESAGGGTSNGIVTYNLATTSQEAHGLPWPFTGDSSAVPSLASGGVMIPPTANQAQPFWQNRGTFYTQKLFVTPSLVSGMFGTSTSCSSTASPANCGSSAAGAVQVAAGARTLTVNTTAVTKHTNFSFTYITTGIECKAPTNIAFLLLPYVSAIAPGSSFTITLPVAPTTNPACVSYSLIN